MRSEEETMAAIMEIKFCNVVVELLIEYHAEIFAADGDQRPVTPRFDFGNFHCGIIQFFCIFVSRHMAPHFHLYQ